jgi:outer membrane protein assembly factor BamE (lipoprotein component of BamABCDE complex)
MNRLTLCAVVLMVLCLMVVACSRHLVGSPIREENIPKIASGKTTRADVLRLFGSPYRIESAGDKEILTYVYGEEMVGSIGIYTERRQRADVLTVYIDRAGVVSDYSFSKEAAIPDFYKQPVMRP